MILKFESYRRDGRVGKDAQFIARRADAWARADKSALCPPYDRVHLIESIDFAALAKAARTPSESLMRMFGPNGNPTAANLAVIGVLQKKTGVHLGVRATAA